MYIKFNIYNKLIIIYYILLELKLCCYTWGLGIGPNPQSPIPNPQSPIPNPQGIVYI